MTPAEVRAALDRLSMFGIKLGLEQTAELFDRCGAPRDLRYLHIAGTNGKGSTGAMLEAALRHCGFRTGFYSSPHLIDMRERFRVNGKAVSEEEFAAVFEIVGRAAEAMRKNGAQPTFFEVTTAMCALIFQRANVDFAVWETGMGGRLDATSIVEPEAAVITNIAMDHQKFLGNTLAAIAGEKAGIIRAGKPVFTGFLVPEAHTVIAAEAARLGSPLVGPEPLTAMSDPVYRHDERGIVQQFRYNGETVQLHLAGAMQRRNFATAVPVLRYLAGKYHFPLEKAIEGAGLARWPARCQIVSEKLVVDGGHNPDGAAALAQTMHEAFPGRKFTVVFAGFRDKDVAENLRLIAPLAARWVFTPIADERPSYTGEELAAMARKAGSAAPVTGTNSAGEALKLAMAGADPVLSVGSLYLAGEVLNIAAPETVRDLA